MNFKSILVINTGLSCEMVPWNTDEFFYHCFRHWNKLPAEMISAKQLTCLSRIDRWFIAVGGKWTFLYVSTVFGRSLKWRLDKTFSRQPHNKLTGFLFSVLQFFHYVTNPRTLAPLNHTGSFSHLLYLLLFFLPARNWGRKIDELIQDCLSLIPPNMWSEFWIENKFSLVNLVIALWTIT